MTERGLAFFFLEGGGGRILIRSVFCSEFTAVQLWPVSMPCAAPPACKLGMSGGSTKLEEANARIAELETRLGDQEAESKREYMALYSTQKQMREKSAKALLSYLIRCACGSLPHDPRPVVLPCSPELFAPAG